MAQTTRQRVLIDLLAQNGAWRSGDTLAQDLGVTRETVWKAINALRKAGHTIEARKSQGYRYVPSAVLDGDAIAYYTKRKLPIRVMNTVTSTQSAAKEMLSRHDQALPFAVIADQQSNGYGRRGRTFFSPENSGLYMSIVFPNPAPTLQNVGLLTTGVANAVCDVLTVAFPEQMFSLKWVNDILLNGRKVGGIITEAVLELESASSAAFVVGVGLNLTTATFPAALTDVAGAIQVSTTVDRNRLAGALIDVIIQMTGEYQTGAFMPAYRKRSATIGKAVTLSLGNEQVDGTVLDVADDGALVLRDVFGEVRRFTSGEVIKVR